MKRKRTSKYSSSDKKYIASVLNEVLACLRAQNLSYQTSHWQSKGRYSYQDHLLFERLYNSVLEEIDTLAEKISGLTSSDEVALSIQDPQISRFLQTWSRIPNHHERGLKSEEDLQNLMGDAFEELTGAGLASLGLEDFLAATSSAHETNIYLLQQALLPTRKNPRRMNPARTNTSDQIKPNNPCRMGTSMAWLDPTGKLYWLHDDQHFKFAEEVLQKRFGFDVENYIGGPNRTLILMDDWIKISNYRDFAMKEYDEERHFDFEAQDEWDFYGEQLQKLTQYIVDCVIYNNDDPNKPIINIVYIGISEFDDERITMTPHDLIYKFGGPKYGKKLLDKMYDGLERKSNPGKSTSVLGALILGGIIGHSMKKK